MSSTKKIEWTPEEIESLNSLDESDLKAVIELLTPEEKESLAASMGESTSSQKSSDKARRDYQDKRREASNAANKRRAAAGSTITIPILSTAQRRKRSALEADPEAWVWEMMGPGSGILEELTRKFTSQQSEMIGSYADTLKHGGDEMMLASRGEGKTSYLRAMVWKSIAEGSVDFVAFIGATGEDATNSAAAIQDNIMRSDPFLELYPEIAVPCRAVGNKSQLANSMLASGSQFDDVTKTFEQHPISFTWTKEVIDMPNVPGSPSARAMLRFRGADSPIRGLNIFGRRPKVVAIDDLDTPDTTNNPDVAKKVVARVHNDIGGLGTPTEPLARLMLATLPQSGIGVAHHFAEAGHPFVVKRFRYLLEKPDRFDMWMEYVKRRQKGKTAGDKHGRNAHQFYLDNRRAMDAGAKVSNEWRFKDRELPDGSRMQVSALQNYFDEWADKGEFFCRCELDNETILNEDRIESRLESGHVINCEGDYGRKVVDPTTQMIVRGVDVRKTELHFSVMASDDHRRHRIADYDVRAHGTTETTVEQAEELIRTGLHRLADEWENNGLLDWNGGRHGCDLTLIDKGWMGNWSEDGERKTWASQPVETFCMERGLRRWLPAKGAPNYRSPAPGDDVIVGDNWHMNRGSGAERACTEVIWNAEHWHALVENLFMLPADDEHRFELFVAETGVWINHKRFSGHITEGAEELADRRQRATRTRKPKFRRDHWWDSCAMMLVARSIEEWFRENLVTRKRKPARPRRPTQQEEIGAR